MMWIVTLGIKLKARTSLILKYLKFIYCQNSYSKHWVHLLIAGSWIFLKLLHITLPKMPQFPLIFWCGNFVERHSFRIVLVSSPETMRRVCLSTKFLHQKISWNYDILGNEDPKFSWKHHDFGQKRLYRTSE